MGLACRSPDERGSRGAGERELGRGLPGPAGGVRRSGRGCRARPRQLGRQRLLGYFGLSISFPFSKSFYVSYFHSMLYLGLLCMYTCVVKHVHILMGSTMGLLGY